MSDIVIKAENLGKKYVIGHQSGRVSYLALRDVWMQSARTIWNKTKDLATGKPVIQGDTLEEIWALKDVNFEIRHGEAIGIIGRNGAGKSTLLKILSRITEPSAGRVTIDGRVASLLEVGTGFHPELTGRENIYLNGTILGMTRKEIKRKFDEIVAFAEVEKYLDTPVKRYSSGMYVRLAFAVAAHVNPEILLVDEVLAVGDAQFQKKCLGKMDEVAKKGRTVLFVSHNMPTIEALCQRGIVLQSGSVIFDDTATEAVNQYMIQNYSVSLIPIGERKDRQGFGRFIIEAIEIYSDGVISTGRDLSVVVSYKNMDRDINVSEFGMSIWTDQDIKLISLSSEFCGGLENIPQRGKVKCVIKKLPLVKGSYFLNFFVSSVAGLEDYIVHATKFHVEDSNFFGTGKSVDPAWGALAVEHQWIIPGKV